MILDFLQTSLRARLLILSGLILVIGIGLLFTFFGIQEQKLHLQQVESQARMLFHQVVLTRRWIADHGGVFLMQDHGLEPNPFLSNNMIVDRAGIPYIRENPALATRHLSEYAKKSGHYWFHITSLHPINPGNSPDSFETDALHAFTDGKKTEATAIVKEKGNTLFRYAAPLFTEHACLECHRDHRVGQVRGTLSVTLPVDALFRQMAINRKWLAAGAAGVIAVLFFALFVALHAFVMRPMTLLRRAMEKHPRIRAATAIKSRDEFGRLALAFDEMQDKISDYQNTLQEKVDKATAGFRETSRRYRALSRKKSDFISRISHELRTPLTSIRGAAEYILSRLDERDSKLTDTSEELRRFAGIIAANTERVERMVNETLDIEKIESGRSGFLFTVFDINEAIRETVRELTPLFNSLNLQVRIDFAEKTRPVRGDRDRIKDVVTNLLVNGFDHSPPNSTLTVACALCDNALRLTVTDQGPGIPPELHEKIFE